MHSQIRVYLTERCKILTEETDHLGISAGSQRAAFLTQGPNISSRGRTQVRRSAWDSHRQDWVGWYNLLQPLQFASLIKACKAHGQLPSGFFLFLFFFFVNELNSLHCPRKCTAQSEQGCICGKFHLWLATSTGHQPPTNYRHSGYALIHTTWFYSAPRRPFLRGW